MEMFYFYGNHRFALKLDETVCSIYYQNIKCFSVYDLWLLMMDGFACCNL